MEIASKNYITITVIVPVYKAEKCLAHCIDSILAQTFKDWELWLIDDGSPDRSGEICDAYAKKDERIKVVHKDNGGVSSARNVGLDMANGKWVVFVDSDDWCEANYLADFFHDTIDLQEGDIVLQSRKNEVDGKVVDTLSLNDAVYQNVAEAMLENGLLTFGAPYCKLYSNKVIQKYGVRFPEAYSYGEDTTFFFRVLTFTKRVITTSKCNYHYVDSYEGSLSKKDHDFKPLAAFLKDSMILVKQIDCDFEANEKLIDTYTYSFKNLILRSMINMYRLKYDFISKKECIKCIKKDLLPMINDVRDIEIMTIKYSPTAILILICDIVQRFRKWEKG